MYSGVLLIFCWTLVLVKSYPTLIYDYYSSYKPNIDNVKDIEFQENDYLINEQHNENSSPCLQNENGDVKCFFTNGAKGKLHPAEYEFLREMEQERNSAYAQNLHNLENSVIMEVVPPANPNYNVYQHDNSPKRYGTYIHGLIPPEEPSVSISSHQSENRLPYNRPARKTLSYDEFLAQLSHDAMMNNILPTMPYLRTPGGQAGGYAAGPVPVQAAFPHAVSGCGQPVLVGCSPVISQGYIPHVHDGYPYVQAPQIQLLNPYSGYALPSRRLVHDKVKIVKPAFVTSKRDFRKELTESEPVDNA